MIRRKLISETVSSLLNSAGITHPAVNVKAIAHAQGALLVEEPNDEKTSGFIFRAAGSPPVIGVNSIHPITRKRFTLAHELGHLLLHIKNGIHIDYAIVKMRDSKTSEGIDEEEIEANRFAAELLMPWEFLKADIEVSGLIHADDGISIARLAKKYDVSVQAMTIRLTSLNMFWM